ncbi:MAG TPA: hypothetical protein VK453_25545 [Micromonosporaceae bacterium]|nr:hypothetical protein [Micromonosporaceae bacterium]
MAVRFEVLSPDGRTMLSGVDRSFADLPAQAVADCLALDWPSGHEVRVWATGDAVAVRAVAESVAPDATAVAR